jgi:hypothetical protein
MEEKVYQHVPGNMAASERKARGLVWKDPRSYREEVHQVEEGIPHVWGVSPQLLDGKHPVLEDGV